MKNILKIMLFGAIITSSCSLLLSSGGSGGGGGGGGGGSSSAALLSVAGIAAIYAPLNDDPNVYESKEVKNTSLLLGRAIYRRNMSCAERNEIFAQHARFSNPLYKSNKDKILLITAIEKRSPYVHVISLFVKRILLMPLKYKDLAIESLEQYKKKELQKFKKYNFNNNQSAKRIISANSITSNYWQLAIIYQAINDLKCEDMTLIVTNKYRDSMNEKALKTAIRKDFQTSDPELLTRLDALFPVSSSLNTAPDGSGVGRSSASNSAISASAVSGGGSGGSFSGADSILHKAIINGEASFVQNLLQHKANPNQKNDEGLTPLLTLLSSGPIDTPVKKIKFQMLLSAGADVNSARPDTGATPLMYASHYENTNLIRTLILHNAIVDTTNNHGETALHVAARTFGRSQNKYFEGIELLLLHKADINNRNNNGEFAFDLVQKHGPLHAKVFEYLKRLLQNTNQGTATAGNNQASEVHVPQAITTAQSGFSSTVPAAAAMTALHTAPAGGGSDGAAPSIQQFAVSSSASLASSYDDSSDDDEIASFTTAEAQAAAQAARVKRKAEELGAKSAAAAKNAVVEKGFDPKRKR